MKNYTPEAYQRWKKKHPKPILARVCARARCARPFQTTRTNQLFCQMECQMTEQRRKKEIKRRARQSVT